MENEIKLYSAERIRDALASAAELAGYVREMLSEMIIEVHMYQEKEVEE